MDKVEINIYIGLKKQVVTTLVCGALCYQIEGCCNENYFLACLIKGRGKVISNIFRFYQIQGILFVLFLTIIINNAVITMYYNFLSCIDILIMSQAVSDERISCILHYFDQATSNLHFYIFAQLAALLYTNYIYQINKEYTCLSFHCFISMLDDIVEKEIFMQKIYASGEWLLSYGETAFKLFNAIMKRPEALLIYSG